MAHLSNIQLLVVNSRYRLWQLLGSFCRHNQDNCLHSRKDLHMSQDMVCLRLQRQCRCRRARSVKLEKRELMYLVM